MRRLALGSLVLACAVQVPSTLLAQAPEEPPVAPLVSTEELAAEQEQAALEADPTLDPAPAGEVVSPVPAEEEGGPTTDRLSIGESVRDSSGPSVDAIVQPAQEAEQAQEAEGETPAPDVEIPTGGDQEDQGTDAPDEQQPDEQDPDEEEFSEEFPDEPEEEPEEETVEETTTFTPVAAPQASSLPNTGADVASLTLVAVALLLAGASLRRVPPARP